MIAHPARLPAARLFACAAAALALSAPLAAQQQPEDFVLLPPTPTPTPAPAGPADERGGVVIPPQPVPVPAPTVRASPLPAPAPAPLIIPPPRPAPTASASPSAAAPSPAQTPSPTPTPVPDDPALSPSTLPPGAPPPLPLPAPDGPVADPGVLADLPGQPALPAWWPWAAALFAVLLPLAGGIAVWRNRRPKVLRLAAPPPGMETGDAPVPDLPRLDVTLDIISATRSVMKFTIAYRINLANRTGRAVSDLTLAVQLASARRGGDNAPSAGAAQQVLGVTRIGPHQNRSLSGEIQLPLAEIEILRQGSTALFIPLLHVTLEGEGQSPLARSFVIGNPSANGGARLHPILLDQPPGSVPGLRAQAIEIPTDSGRG